MLTLFSGCPFPEVRCLGSLDLCLMARETTRDSWTWVCIQTWLWKAICALRLSVTGQGSTTPLTNFVIYPLNVLPHTLFVTLHPSCPERGRSIRSKKNRPLILILRGLKPLNPRCNTFMPRHNTKVNLLPPLFALSNSWTATYASVQISISHTVVWLCFFNI